MNLDEYEDYDFEELPKDVKTYIIKLGYTKEIWDYDDYDWDELPEKIKTAVTNAGYTQETWDNDVSPENLQENINIWWVLKTLWPSIWKHRVTAGLLILVLTGHVLSTIALAISLESLFDDAIPNKDIGGVITIGGILIGILVVASLAAVLQARWVAKLNAGIIYDLQRRLYEHILRLKSSSVSKARSGDLLARFSTDMAPVAEAVGSGVSYIVMYLFVVVGSVGAILWIDWRMGVGTLILFGGGAILGRRFPNLASKATREFKEAESQVLSAASETIRSHTLISTFGLRTYFARRFKTVAANQRKAQDQAGYRLYLAEMLAEYGSMTLVALTIVAGAFLAIYGYVTPGALVAIFTLLIYVQEGVYEMAEAGSTLLGASGGLARIQELLNRPVEDPDEEKPAIGPLVREIALNKIRLSFDGKKVLSKVSFSIKRGQHVAILGRSGSGKSTLLRLIMRLLEPDKGQLSWDGSNLQDFSRASVRDQLGVVFQEPTLIGNTIREVIAVGRDDLSDDEIEAVIRIAVLEDFAASLPSGLDTPLGEEGRELSMGQRMRLALARALVRNPSVLILDEVTAALDTSTEAQIIDTISDLTRERTIISVTHRLSVAQNADHIIILDGGKIVEEGSHEELMSLGGYYANIHAQQTAISSKGGQLQIAPEHLASIPILSNLGIDKLKLLATRFRQCRFASGSTIVRQGAPSEEFYILHRGKLEVLVGDKVVGRLDDGDFFGEMGLLFKIPRTGTVRALTPASCLRMDRDDFEHLVVGEDGIQATLLAAARYRSSENDRTLTL